MSDVSESICCNEKYMTCSTRSETFCFHSVEFHASRVLVSCSDLDLIFPLGSSLLLTIFRHASKFLTLHLTSHSPPPPLYHSPSSPISQPTFTSFFAYIARIISHTVFPATKRGREKKWCNTSTPPIPPAPPSSPSAPSSTPPLPSPSRSPPSKSRKRLTEWRFIRTAARARIWWSQLRF